MFDKLEVDVLLLLTFYLKHLKCLGFYDTFTFISSPSPPTHTHTHTLLARNVNIIKKWSEQRTKWKRDKSYAVFETISEVCQM